MRSGAGWSAPVAAWPASATRSAIAPARQTVPSRRTLERGDGGGRVDAHVLGHTIAPHLVFDIARVEVRDLREVIVPRQILEVGAMAVARVERIDQRLGLLVERLRVKLGHAEQHR